MLNRFFSFFALFFGIGFASPLLITLANGEGLAIDPLWLAITALLLVVALSTLAYFLANKTRFARPIANISLALALVLAIEGNFIHDLFYYGNFNGELTDWRQYGWKFWAEWVGFLLSFPLFYWLLNRFRQTPTWLTLVPVMSSVLLIAPAVFNLSNTPPLGLADDNVNPDVFEFSSELNLVHLLPDGFQADIAREVLEDYPELAARMGGFTLYRDHVGMYQGTAPSVPTIFMGRPFNFEAGYDVKRTVAKINQHAYPTRLREHGFRLDYVVLSSAYCVKDATSCIVRGFNDLKPRGYFRHKDQHVSYAIRQLTDLTLFRHLPMFLKERIYNDGDWLFADTTLDGSSPWPDPVLREWIDNMVVSGPQPRYKWYHYIGTHIPPHWDAECVFNKELERTRKQYYDQSFCVLTGIARFADKLRELGIFDQTAIIISGDHGINIEPDDMTGVKANSSLYAGVIGAARPALMIKPLHNRANFEISNVATALQDIAPTALDLVGLKGDYSGQSVLDIDPVVKRTRIFNRYTSDEFWSGKPISNDLWQINGSSRNLENWSLRDIFYSKAAPAKYPVVNYSTAYATSRGLSLNRHKPDDESSWVDGTEFTILVGTEHPELAARIEFELSLPDFMTAVQQTFKVFVNHQPLAENFTLEQSDDWVSLVAPLPDGLLKQGNNQVTLKFSETAQPEETNNWRAAAKLKSFNLIQ